MMFRRLLDHMFNGSALALTGISDITVEDGNRHFRVSDNCLLDFDPISVIRYFGSDSDVILKREIAILNTGCFYSCKSLCSLVFESGSQLTRIEANALCGCSSLKSICLPALVEFLGEGSFSNCGVLWSLRFESESNLTRIESYELYGCSSLKSICLPASVEFLGEGAFSICGAL
jgi:hypothetical protein